MASSSDSVALHTAELVQHLSLLGFTINWQKSSPHPSQSIIYLEMHMKSLDMKARLSLFQAISAQPSSVAPLATQGGAHSFCDMLAEHDVIQSRGGPSGFPPHEDSEMIWSLPPQPNSAQEAYSIHPLCSADRSVILGKPLVFCQQGFPSGEVRHTYQFTINSVAATDKVGRLLPYFQLRHILLACYINQVFILSYFS